MLRIHATGPQAPAPAAPERPRFLRLAVHALRSCPPACPTYAATKIESDTVRAGGFLSCARLPRTGAEPSRAFAQEMYFCLGCLACMSACPAGVHYAQRAARRRRPAASCAARTQPGGLAIRWGSWMQPAPTARRLLRLCQEVGLQAAAPQRGLEALPRAAVTLGDSQPQFALTPCIAPVEGAPEF